jgi:hypothetical protein
MISGVANPNGNPALPAAPPGNTLALKHGA